MTRLLRRLRRSERGATFVEYGLMILCVVAVCVLALKALGSKVNGEFNTLGTKLEMPNGGGSGGGGTTGGGTTGGGTTGGGTTGGGTTGGNGNNGNGKNK